MAVIKGLEWTFDTAAEVYEKMRPGYVEELYQDIFQYIPVDESSNVVEIGIGGGQATPPVVKTGCKMCIRDRVEDAVNLGKSGNVVVRYKALKDLEHQNKVYDIAFSFDKEAITSVVENKCDAFNVEAIDAHLKRVDGSFVIEDLSLIHI